jgi:predicted phosphodiesterase
MLIAFISDIHGNLLALEAAFADAKAHRADQVVCAGDTTGYGPFSDEVCHFLQKQHISTILGNYDRKVIEVAKHGPSVTAGMKEKKRKILLWTVVRLHARTRRYLAGLPECLDLRLPSGHRLLVVHGSPISMDDAIYPSVTRQGLKTKLSDARPDILVCGHTHIPFVKRVNGTLVVNCGSTGHPVDGDPRPAYALVRAEQDTVPRGRIVRFEYDRSWMVATIKRTSLPKGLLKDFSEGIKMGFFQ